MKTRAEAARRDMTSGALYRAHWVNQQSASPALYLLSKDIILDESNEKCFAKRKKKIHKNKYTHVCFSFINFTVYTVSVGLSWEFPCS